MKFTWKRIKTGGDMSAQIIDGKLVSSEIKANVKVRVDALKAELADARAGRDSVAQSLDARLRSKYENVFKRRAGLAVVTIVNGTCSGCHMYVPPQTINEIRKSGVIHVCPSCQRILYVSDAV